MEVENHSVAALREKARAFLPGGSFGNVGAEAQICAEPCLFDIVFTGQPIVDYWSWESGDKAKNERFDAVLQERGVIKGASKLYISVAHTQDDIDHAIDAFEAAAAELARH